jgi:hypothetical protein
MPEVPAWLGSLVEAMAGGMLSQGPPGPLGNRYLGQELLGSSRKGENRWW